MQQYIPLSPLMLGRPLQALAALAERLAQHAQRHLQQSGHRAIALKIQHPRLEPLASAGLHAPGTSRVELTRETVQAYMAMRYGFTAPESKPQIPAAPASGTERRISQALETALQQALDDWLAQDDTGENTEPTAPGAASGPDWQWSAQIHMGEHPAQPLRITLGAVDGRRLERWAAQLRAQARAAARPAHAATPSTPLQIHLAARLLEKPLTAAQLQHLQPGSVLPITLGHTTVLLNGSAMLSASVAEHQGQLHLTDFETLE